jgi:hypothetical protein
VGTGRIVPKLYSFQARENEVAESHSRHLLFWYIVGTMQWLWFAVLLAADDSKGYGSRLFSPENLPNIGLFVAGIIGIGVAVRTLKNLERQTAAIEKQGDALVNSERAWVLVEIGTLPDFSKVQPDTAAILYIMPKIQNFGRTTARIMKICMRQLQVPKADDLPPEPEYTDELSFDFVLPPNKPIQTMGVPITATEYVEMREGKTVLYIFGYVSYVDIGSTERVTRFCLIYVAPSGFNPIDPGFYPAINAPASYTKIT